MTTGTVAVIGAGKMGLTLAGQYASHGWTVMAVDIRPEVVDAINAGTSLVDEPGLAPLIEDAVKGGRLTATLDAAAAARTADVVVLIVPLDIDIAHRPDFRIMDAAVDAIGPGIHAGQTVVFETTLPVGTTRTRYVPRLERASGLKIEDDLFVAFSPERLSSGTALRDLARYPKVVGGVGPKSHERAVAFYRSVLDADVIEMSSADAAEMSKLAETTYRDVNIGLANEFARYAEAQGLDVTEVIAAANSQPYSHIHQPGLGVGGHCIPVYPHLMLAGGDLELARVARRINDEQVDLALGAIEDVFGSAAGVEVLVLGLTYRAGVKEMAHSQGPILIRNLNAAGAKVSAADPLLSDAEVEQLGGRPHAWGSSSEARAIVVQTADPRWLSLDANLFPKLQLLVDGRNSLRTLSLPEAVVYRGVGVARP